MARQRLGVVLLIPQPTSSWVNGLRRALGDQALSRIEPHITLVPPINVAEKDLPAVFATVRQAAASVAPLSLRLGPVATFVPVNPVAYLEVTGAPTMMEGLERLRTGCGRGPLERSADHAFVPHVTVANDLSLDRLDAAERALADFTASVTVARVHVLAEFPGRVWRSLGDAPLGVEPDTIGRGSLPLALVTSGRPEPEAAALLSFASASEGLPFAITAYREQQVVGAAWGWSGRGVLEVADLTVAGEHRGQGVGAHMLAAVQALARRRHCTRVGANAAPDGAAGALLTAAGFSRLESPDASSVVRRWERQLRPGGEPR